VFTYVCLGSNHPERAAVFYDAVLGALGLRRVDTASEPDWNGWYGWGTYENEGAREIALWINRPFNGEAATVANGSMVAFRATSWAEVDAFHAQALAHGGSSEGAPGLRLQYNTDFYAAYVRDPEGHKLAAVCRGFTAPQ
jgi:catechol 2,3-dioxygenase-like lactoylglutathione lyase family enzyme